MPPEKLRQFLACPTAAVIILLKPNHTAHNSSLEQSSHLEKTCPQAP